MKYHVQFIALVAVTASIGFVHSVVAPFRASTAAHEPRSRRTNEGLSVVPAGGFHLQPAMRAGSSSESRSPAPRYDRVDHFWWLVRDIKAVELLFRDTLGFTLGPDVRYSAADLRHIWFSDGSFLEFVAQRAEAPALGEAVSAFLQKHEGAWKMGIGVNDVDAVTRDLTARGLKTSKPEGGTWQGLGGRKDLPPEMWKGVDLLSAPGHLAYFWHFTPGWSAMRARMPDLDPLSAERTTHANTALGLRTPWLATWDLERTRRECGFLDPTTGPTFDVPHLQATGQWLELARGRLLLLQPTTRASPVMQYLFVRGEGVMGASIEVRDLELARRFIETRSRERFPTYAGLEGTSIMLSASLTHGVAVERFER